jgi:hypothetical protein
MRLFLLAIEKASQEYEKFNKTQEIESDFDRELKKVSVRRKAK